MKSPIINYYFLVITLFFLCACKSAQEKTVAPYQIDLEQSESSWPQPVEIKLIPLETNDFSLINAIDKLIYHQGTYYVFDRMGKKIQLFDEQGNYLRSIAKLGQGPGEYTEPGDIDVDEEGDLYISDWNTQSILMYPNADPTRYEKIAIGKSFLDFAVCNDFIYLNNVLGEKGVEGRIAIWDKKSKQMIYWQENDFPEEIAISWDATHHLFRSGHQLYRYARFTSSIDRLEKGKNEPFIHFLTSRIPTTETARNWLTSPMDKQLEEKMRYISDVRGCYEAGKYLYANLASGPSIHILLDKESGKSWHTSRIGNIPSRGAIATTGTYFVSYCTVEQQDFKKLISVLSDPQKRTEMEKLPDDSNPVLVLFRF